MKQKKIILSIICVIVFFAFSCKSNCDTTTEKPDALQSIDWESYNDVYSVWWNYRSNDGIIHEDLTMEKEIKLYGNFDNVSFRSYFESEKYGVNFKLIDDHKHDFIDVNMGFSKHYAYTITIDVFSNSSFDKDDILERIETWTSLSKTKKCYVKGTLRVGAAGGAEECPPYIYPHIFVNNFNDIYFE